MSLPIGGWNYRVAKDRDGSLAIYEVYYDTNGNPVGISERAMEPWGEHIEELRRDMALMMAALEKPVLNYDEIGLPGEKL